MTHAPTQKQVAIHAFMLAYQTQHGMPPVMREVAKQFGYRSLNAVACALRALEKKGMMRHRKGVARAWRAIAPEALATKAA